MKDSNYMNRDSMNIALLSQYQDVSRAILRETQHSDVDVITDFFCASKLVRQRKMERRRARASFVSAALLLSSAIKRNYVSSLTMFDRAC